MLNYDKGKIEISVPIIPILYIKVRNSQKLRKLSKLPKYFFIEKMLNFIS